MSYTKTILCLANSRKMSGRCVAGKEMNGSVVTGWVRPISDRPTREISLEERRYENGNDPDILDIVTIPMKGPSPETYQTENYLIDADYYWELKGRANWTQVLGALDNVPGPLWINESSTYNGQNDQLQEQTALQFKHSLLLIRPIGATISVAREGGVYAPAKRAVRASFSFNSLHYKLKVTDPYIEHKYFRGEDGSFSVSECIICVSLSELFNGHVYKLVATMITPERAG
ncbi:MAG: hypothetical protein M0Z28_06945 [Rhodospirillales bacterium]|nr:hypothetical protein [Rhodospirillales bacterium]